MTAPIGAPIDAIDTPSIILDLDVFEANARRMADRARDEGKGWRADAYVHKTPAIAAVQCAYASCHGITVRSVSEAEVFAAAGCSNILLTRPVVGAQTRARVDALAERVQLSTSRDGEELDEDAATLQGAVTVSARVASCPEPGRAITDCGQKAIGNDFGKPGIFGRDDLRAIAGSAEHGMLLASKERPDDLPYAIGDWLQLVPGDVATTFNLHDFVFAVRDGLLVATWPIAARGAYT